MSLIFHDRGKNWAEIQGKLQNNFWIHSQQGGREFLNNNQSIWKDLFVPNLIEQNDQVKEDKFVCWKQTIWRVQKL